MKYNARVNKGIGPNLEVEKLRYRISHVRYHEPPPQLKHHHPSRQILLEPRHPLLRRLVLALLILLGAEVPPQRKAMHLVLIQLDLMRHIRLFRQDILDLPNAIHVQQTVLRPQRQAQRLRHRVKVARYGHQARVARERCIHPADARAVFVLGLPVRLQDGVAAAPGSSHQHHWPHEARERSIPAEANRPDLVRARDHAHGVDEAVDLRATDPLAVGDQPRA